MNEASSKFVDTLAMSKLIDEKLTKVSHSPKDSCFDFKYGIFNGWGERCLKMSDVENIKDSSGVSCFVIPSFQKSVHYTENGMIYLYYHAAPNPVGNVLLLHGLFDDNMLNYAYLIKLLNQLNLNVFFMVLPYHYDRRPQASTFSGEFFFSADVYRSQSAFGQAVYDIEASLQFMEYYNSIPSIVAGFSMGGCIALRHHLVTKQAAKLFLINPVTDLTRLIWDNPLLLSIGRDLERSGFDMSIYESIYSELDPCKNLYSGFDAGKIAMIYSIYDQIIDQAKYEKFIDMTGIKKAYPYSAGHLNVLRVPKLSKDIYDFFMEIK